MSELFLKIVNMSISASWVVIAVLTLRFCLKKAPKWVNVLLWGIVAARMVFPFSIESVLSLIPSAETISPTVMMEQTPSVQTGVPALNHVINPVISSSFTPAPGASANPLQIWIPVLTGIWLFGIAALFLYSAVSYWRLHRKVCEAVILRGNIYQSEKVCSPFVLGIIKPKIYLPYHMDSREMDHVIAHEQTHIRRKDHWWKPLGFLLLTIHWFNPLMWLSYILLCRDIELACDEKVIRGMGNAQRADYTQALVACSISRRSIAACPLAFGEVGVKERVKSVMNYKKPAFWIVLASVIVCAAAAVCFLTNPKSDGSNDIIGYLPLYWHFLYISIALAAERSCMAEVHVFGRVTNDLQLKMSHRQVPYVSFGLVEWIGRRDTGHRQYFEVWAWGTAALSLADAEIHKDSRIWVQGFLELVDCTRNGGSEKDKRLKLSLTGWQTKPPRTAQSPARKQSPGAAQPPLPPVEVVDGDRERLPE